MLNPAFSRLIDMWTQWNHRWSIVTGDSGFEEYGVVVLS